MCTVLLTTRSDVGNALASYTPTVIVTADQKTLIPVLKEYVLLLYHYYRCVGSATISGCSNALGTASPNQFFLLRVVRNTLQLVNYCTVFIV